MAKYVHIVERDCFHNYNGCDYRGGATISDVRVFSNKASALAYIADCISLRVSKDGCEFKRYNYMPEEIKCSTIKEYEVYSQEQYNKNGWRTTYSYKKMLVETEFIK